MATRDVWLNGQQAAAYCGRSDEWLRKKVNAGKIRFSLDPLNGRKMYSKAVLDKAIRPVSIESYVKSLKSA